jgi:hypothetical protein
MNEEKDTEVIKALEVFVKNQNIEELNWLLTKVREEALKSQQERYVEEIEKLKTEEDGDPFEAMHNTTLSEAIEIIKKTYGQN